MDIQERHELYREYLDNLVQTGVKKAASRLTGFSRASATRWMQASKVASKTTPDDQRANSEWFFEWPLGSGEFDWFWRHERQAKRTIVEDILVSALVRARDGVTSYNFDRGHRVPRYDLELSELLGVPPEQCIMRDASGEIVWETTHTAPSNELTLAVLGAYTSRFSKKVSVQHQHQHSGGVSVAHSMASRAALQASKSVPMLEVIDPVANEIVEAEITEQPSQEQDTATPDVGVEPTPVSRVQSPLRMELEKLARERGIL